VDPQPRGDFRHPGLGFSRFARHYSGNHSLFSSPPGTEMFHFPGFAPPVLWIQTGVPRHDAQGVSPFGHFRLNGRLAPPRNFSQPPTSFIASEHLGIHHTPLVAYLPQSLCPARCLRLTALQHAAFGRHTRNQGPGPQDSSSTQGPAYFICSSHSGGRSRHSPTKLKLVASCYRLLLSFVCTFQ
jgi:hypothetical protein